MLICSVAYLMQEWQAAGVEQLRLSTVDLTGVPTLENLHRGVDFALKHREQGNSVYVHCKAGRSRSATLVAAYLIKVSLKTRRGLLKHLPNPGFISLFFNRCFPAHSCIAGLQRKPVRSWHQSDLTSWCAPLRWTC